jgi:CheY-like chemotaxis protein
VLASIVLADGNLESLNEAACALTGAGYQVVALGNPIAAIEVIEGLPSVELLITQVDFGPNRPHGISIARMAMIRRPNIKVLFIARPEHIRAARAAGDVIAMPFALPDLLEAAEHVLLWQPASQGGAAH